MILVINLHDLYKTYTNKDNFDYSNSSLKDLQNFLKIADVNQLKTCSQLNFDSWKELTDKMNTDRKAFPNAFFLKEIK